MYGLRQYLSLFPGRTTVRTCTGSDCSKICGGNLTCIRNVESVEYSGHCYNDVMLMPRTDDFCKFAPCPNNANNTKFCKCCKFPSYRNTCPDICASSYCSNITVQGKLFSILIAQLNLTWFGSDKVVGQTTTTHTTHTTPLVYWSERLVCAAWN